MQPTVQDMQVNGISLAYFEWPGASDNHEPPLVFAHATGFHARVWDAIIAHFPDRRVLSLDLRGHGRSDGGPIEHWNELVGDVCAFVDELGIRGAVGIGHSMGAHTLLQAAQDRPGAFGQLVLFDPVILAPEFYTPCEPLFTADNPHPASRRKRDFASPEAMIERFRDRDPYDIFDPRVFEDYCRFGLTKRESDAGYELACAPEVEASVYASSRSNAAIHETARNVNIPVLVVRAKQSDAQDFKGSPTWPELAAILPKGKDMHRPDRTHFHPFEDPTDAARIIKEAMDG
ncbi:MAG: alpha/beta hydrolase [Pseudomonadota bacterium]